MQHSHQTATTWTLNNATQGNSTQQSSCDGAYERPWTSFNIQYSFFCYFDTFPWQIFSKLWGAKSYPSEKLSPKPHFLLRHFLTFSIIARIIYALMCQTCYIRYHKIYSAKFKQKRKNIYFVDYILVPKKRFQV